MENSTKGQGLQIDYLKLIAAQNESNRRLKISQIQHILTEENEKKVKYGIATAIGVIGVLATGHFLGIKIEDTIPIEIQSLSTIESLMPYISKLGPSILALLAATGIVGIFNPKYIKASEEYRKANNDFYTIIDNEPTDLFGIVESQGRKK